MWWSSLFTDMRPSDFFNFSFLPKYGVAFVRGIEYTLLLAVVSVLLAVIPALLLALMRLSKVKPVKWLSGAYIAVFRSTPMLVQLSIIYFGLFYAISLPRVSLFGFVDISRFVPGVVALALNSSAYVAEIFRAGILAVDKGQTEAGRSTGLTQAQTMLYIIWPQAFRRMIPPLTNQCIISLKDTSLLVVIGVGELTRQGQEIIAVNFRAFEVWLTVAIFYLAMTLSISAVLRYYERKLMIGRRAVPASPSDPQM